MLLYYKTVLQQRYKFRSILGTICNNSGQCINM